MNTILHRSRFTPLLLVIAIFYNGTLTGQDPPGIRQAHAHNDYLHKRPLLDALDCGFCSVEADIYLVDGQLLVAHTQSELSPDRTLRSLYLDPLRARIQKHSGKVHADVPVFTLLIDIKSDGKTTYRALHSLLSEYRDIFSYVEQGMEHPGAVKAIVSGSRAVDLISAEAIRYVGIDGRLSDLDSDLPDHLLPLISDNWALNFRWRGVGELPASDREKLTSVIDRAHKKNRLVRFWGTPDNVQVWTVLKDAGVDLINTDDLKGLSGFLGAGKRAVNDSSASRKLPWIKLSDDRKHLVGSEKVPFRVWGVNYDHDDSGRLLEDYWGSEWDSVVEDFSEIKALGANVVRIHLQTGKFMSSPGKPNEAALLQLSKLIDLAEGQGLYLNLTGLGCYHKNDVPEWYDGLDESARWAVQARFWESIAKTAVASPAVFCYDLMNEPILPGEKPETEWLAGAFGDKTFVQRISLNLEKRSREQVASAWVRKMCDAIRSVDSQHLITVGVIPWAHIFPGAKPLFYAPSVGEPLDFASVHFYPKAGEVQRALDALDVYRVGKPIVVEEIFPLSCSLEEAAEFIDKANVDGFTSFYWGKTIEQNEKAGDIKGAIVAKWLRYFRQHAASQ